MQKTQEFRTLSMEIFRFSNKRRKNSFLLSSVRFFILKTSIEWYKRELYWLIAEFRTSILLKYTTNQ